MDIHIIVNKKSGLFDDVYVGALLNSTRAADMEFDGRSRWYLEGDAVPLKFHTCSVLGDGRISGPIQLLTDALTRNAVWLTLSQSHHASTNRVRLPALVSTSSKAVLQAIPIELVLFCKRCHQSPDFLAGLEWCVESLSRSPFAISIKNQLLHNARNTSTLTKVMPVNFVYEGKISEGALQVNSTMENISSAILYIVTDQSDPIHPDGLSGIELKRVINVKNNNYEQTKVFEFTMGMVA